MGLAAQSAVDLDLNQGVVLAMQWKRPLLILSVLLATLALNGSNARGEAAARINIAPWGFAHPPVKLDIIVHIDRDKRNRSATIVLNSDGYYSSSDIQLDGDKAPFLFRREVPRLGPGLYQAFLELHQWTGSSWKTETFKSETLEVLE